jgi:hypothetical protein
MMNDSACRWGAPDATESFSIVKSALRFQTLHDLLPNHPPVAVISDHLVS